MAHYVNDNIIYKNCEKQKMNYYSHVQVQQFFVVHVWIQNMRQEVIAPLECIEFKEIYTLLSPCMLIELAYR